MEALQVPLQLLYSGIALGMIYAVIAFGYQLTFQTSDTLNFGQGDALMLGAMVGLTLVGLGLNYWLMLPTVIVFGMLQGGLVEWLGVRPALKIKSEFGWIMSTIALGIIFKNVAENLWGRDDLKFPSPLPESPLSLLGAKVLPMEILVVFGAIAMMLAVELFNRKTIYGKAVVATFNDRDAAGLMGINTGLVITFSYALSSASAALAGVLIAPLTLTGATMGAVLGLKAFAVAIIGGLTSGLGIIVGGIMLGAAEMFTGYYVSSGYKDVPGLLLLLLVLALKPAGLFGKTAIKKV
ncbi:branched-chain amino acid ABC transporter permease [Verminephrobacter eiseniae]|uniref:branched-chain amino acid ABC transporter permease n=1 Tax=Verminephrobacter eiseniae TaxID=364317 RepID=UPI002238DD73|nr:branched-chain amino acid ABC transporter permease [Verminephrobacter eiseniae]MCW5233448.1 branched-chain amino acid ABC transporter permease [Verminephrobacter eiseniae]MCW5261601.1 branched-chain amino acid ABC transporter permease [Verminephrobacter eiseniae]MCW5294999.1 branched-chain amino acid ABC transporter permease [Verminephrobacter eiseniae]MCW8184207.1 branched-chain amino acid ABC transporter permease [Verminephrobacter eiseniae]MCW8222744.1 branched-chain amino acid ABC trans